MYAMNSLMNILRLLHTKRKSFDTILLNVTKTTTKRLLLCSLVDRIPCTICNKEPFPGFCPGLSFHLLKLANKAALIKGQIISEYLFLPTKKFDKFLP